MKALDSSRYAFGVCLVIAILAGCGGHGTVPVSAAKDAGAATPTAYHMLHQFSGGLDGANVDAGLIEVNHFLYGTTAHGGAYDRGTFYHISTTGDEKVLYHFGKGSDGAKPHAGPIAVNGTFYGTTEAGGSSNQGTVFSMVVTGRGIGQETVLHSFAGSPDGNSPFGGLLYVNGTLYGTTFGGGKHGMGTVFSISPSGNEKVLHSFAGGSDGASPYSGLTDVNDTLYGTTSGGGTGCPNNPSGCGTVYSISTTTGKEMVLYGFAGGSDGNYPFAPLLAMKGTLYGTTLYGGSGCSSSSSDGCGTVYGITPTGKETVLHRFDDSDGYAVYAGLAEANGTLYGAAGGGGAFGRGLIYSMSPTGRETVLYTYRHDSTGWGPLAPPIDVKGTLYGTTQYGGSTGCKNFAGCGTVYALTP
jgi:uncharacterized repeat protein (TIGR03803 family)